MQVVSRHVASHNFGGQGIYFVGGQKTFFWGGHLLTLLYAYLKMIATAKTVFARYFWGAQIWGQLPQTPVATCLVVGAAGVTSSGRTASPLPRSLHFSRLLTK